MMDNVGLFVMQLSRQVRRVDVIVYIQHKICGHLLCWIHILAKLASTI